MLALVCALYSMPAFSPVAAQDSKPIPEQARVHRLFGSILCDIGDADGDGVPDLIVGDTDPKDGHVWLTSLAKGQSLYSTPALGYGSEFATDLFRVGDVDGDGHDDWVINGHHWGPRDASESARLNLKLMSTVPERVRFTQVLIHSGKDGRVIRSFEGGDPLAEIGRCACAVGDFDADGRADVALGCVRIGPPGKGGALVSIRSGKDGSELRALGASQAEGWRAERVTALGDLDGDGTVDIAVLGEDAEGHNPIIQIFSGKTGAELRRMLPYGATPALLAVGDHDGDGVSDYLVGMTPCVQILSGKTGSLLFEMTQDPVLVSSARKSTYCDNDFGSAAVMLRERNSNVGAQFVVSAPNTAVWGGTIYFHDASNGHQLATYTVDGDENVKDEVHHLGNVLANIGDVDGDGYDDLACGTENADGSVQGLAFVFSGRTHARLYTLRRKGDEVSVTKP